MPHRPRPTENSPAAKLSDLLPIHESISKPNPYQVFGIKDGERDSEAVNSAMRAVYQRLKDTKPTADPTVWNQAAKIAEAARKVLEDPERRRALDVSLGATNNKPAKDSSGDSDPLAGLLPTNPAAESTGSDKTDTKNSTSSNAAAILGVPPTASTSSAASVLGTPPLGHANAGSANANNAAVGAGQDQSPSHTSQLANSAPGQSGSAPAVSIAVEDGKPGGWAPKALKRRRRKSNVGVYVFGVFVVAMIGVIIWLLLFLTQGNRVAITPGEGIGIDDAAVVGPTVDPTDDSESAAPKSDGVMPSNGASGIADSIRNPDLSKPPQGSGIGKFVPKLGSDDAVGEDDADNSMTDMTPPPIGMSPNPPAPEPQPTPAPEPTPQPTAPGSMDPQPTTPDMSDATTPDMAEATPPDTATAQANAAKINAVEELIRNAKWSQMKPAADALLKLELTPEQSEHASTLYDIADLAMYYRGALERGLGTLQTGATFEIVKDFPVIVVQTTADSLTIQYSRRTKTFTIDQFPPTLAQKIASLALDPDKPDSMAGQALYRLIHPDSRGEYREDTLAILESVDGELEQVDTGKLLTVVQQLFAN